MATWHVADQSLCSTTFLGSRGKEARRRGPGAWAQGLAPSKPQWGLLLQVVCSTHAQHSTPTSLLGDSSRAQGVPCSVPPRGQAQDGRAWPGMLLAVCSHCCLVPLWP